jgi:CDP-diacylglycerol--glycerol-3-phosphate 3-phosphatidyltransferase
LLVIKDGVIPASKGGKIKTLTQNFGVGFFMLPFPSWLEWFRVAFISVAIILTVTTAYDYIKVWRKGSIKE